jgi:hypothetical protein
MKVALIVRNLKGFTKNGNSRQVVTVIPEYNLGAAAACPVYGKMDGAKYSEKEGGYLIYGGFERNRYLFEKGGYEIATVIRLN